MTWWCGEFERRTERCIWVRYNNDGGDDVSVGIGEVEGEEKSMPRNCQDVPVVSSES